VAAGKTLGEPLRHEKQVNSAQFSSDGTRILTASGDGTVRVWDAATGKTVGEPLRDSLTTSAQFSPDGTRILTATWNTAQVWDAATGKPLGEPLRQEDEVTSAQFSPDGTRIVTASNDTTARLWDVAEFTHPPVPVPAWMLARACAIARLEFGADGQMREVPDDERRATLTVPPPGDDEWSKLARWLAQPAKERTLTPDSKFTCRQIAERERDTLLEKGLESALRYDPMVPLARILLAGALLREQAAKELRRNESREEDPSKWAPDPSLPQRAAFLRDYDLQRMPDDAALWERAVRALHEQKDEERTRRALVKLEKLDKDRAAAVRKELGL
jgi:hypothetical protein